jgi:uncharacterized membrane protein YebE (DUF533 family)
VHAAVIGEAIASGDIAYAQQWYKDHQERDRQADRHQASRSPSGRHPAPEVAGYTGMLLQAPRLA